MGALLNLVQVVLVAVVVVATVTQVAELGPVYEAPEVQAQVEEPTPEIQIKKQAFAAERQQILDEISKLADEARWSDVQIAAQPWLDIEDPDLLAQYNSAREQDLVRQLKTVPASAVDNNLDLYTTLVTLNPEKDRYRKKQDHYKSLLDESATETERVAEVLCQGIARAETLVPSTTTLKALGTSHSERDDGTRELSLALQAEQTDGGVTAYQVDCLLGRDKAVALTDWSAF